MILDEPTEALDPVNRSLLMDIVNEQRDKGATVILVTHRMDEVEQLCDRILLLKDGEAALYGTIDEVKEKFGASVIALEYNGKIPSNDTLYKISKQLPHSAELIRNKDVDSDKILRFLAENRELHLTGFNIRRQSLNDIFLALYKNEREK
jgi:ABC-2 type transport system ATP-binding protein